MSPRDLRHLQATAAANMRAPMSPRVLDPASGSSDEETPPLPRIRPSRPQRASSRSLRERSRSRDGPPDARFGAVFAEAGSDPGDSSEPGRPRTRDHLHRKHYRAWLAHLQGIVGTQAAPNESMNDERERRDVRRLLTDFQAFVLENEEWWWTSPMARLLRRHNELQQRKAIMRRWLRRLRLGAAARGSSAW